MMDVEFQVESVEIEDEFPVAVLREVEGIRTIRVYIGVSDAAALLEAHTGITMPRPTTQDLIARILTDFDIHVSYVKIRDFKNGVFYASIVLTSNGKEFVLDCRPSDAINLALRKDKAVLVDSEVLQKLEIKDSKTAMRNGWLKLVEALREETKADKKGD